MTSRSPESAGSNRPQDGHERVPCPIARAIIPDCRGRFREIFGVPDLIENHPVIAVALQGSADTIQAALEARAGIGAEVIDVVRQRLMGLGLSADTSDEVFAMLLDSLEYTAREDAQRRERADRLQHEADAWVAQIPVAQLPAARLPATAPLRAGGWRHPLRALRALGSDIAERWSSGNVLCMLEVNGEGRTFARALPLATQSYGLGSTVDMNDNHWLPKFEALRAAVESGGGRLTAITREAMGGTVPSVTYQKGRVCMLDHHRIMAAMHMGLPIEVSMMENGEGVGG